jgi:hypothetical protein
LQGLIQLAAACLHVEKGRLAPAGRLLALGLEKLEGAPPDFHGIPVETLRAEATSLQALVAAGSAPVGSARFLSRPRPSRTE